MLKEVIVSELTDQFYEIKNLIYEKFLFFITYLSDFYDLTFIKLKSQFDVLKNIISSFTKYFSKAYEMVLTRLNLELSDLKIIISSFTNSLSENGKIAAVTIAIIILAFALIIILKPKPEPGNKTSKHKSKSIRGQLLEIEIDLLELQDKFSRNVISYNSYLAETKRLEERVNKLQ